MNKHFWDDLKEGQIYRSKISEGYALLVKHQECACVVFRLVTIETSGFGKFYLGPQEWIKDTFYEYWELAYDSLIKYYQDKVIRSLKEPPLTVYLGMLVELDQTSEEERDKLRDAMDVVWKDLTPKEIDSLKNLNLRAK